MKLRPRRSDLAKSQSWWVGSLEFKPWWLAVISSAPWAVSVSLPACPLHIFSLTEITVGACRPITSTCLTCLDPQNCPGCFMCPSLQSPCIQRSDMGMWLFLPPQSWDSTLTLFCFLLPWVRASPSSTLHWTPGYLCSPLVWCLDLGQRAGSGAWTSAVLSTLGRRALYQYFGHKPS